MMKQIWNKWKELTVKIGNFQAGIIFSGLYFLLIAPIGLIAGKLSDYLSTKSFPIWKETADNSSTVAKLRKQHF